MRVDIPVNWKPRDYQLPLWNYLVNGGKRAVCNYHRRAGKDLLCLNWIAACALMPHGSHPNARIGTYWHVFPEFQHGRRAIWDTSRTDVAGMKFLDAFPKELRSGSNDQEMRISFKNGSTYQIVGGDDTDRLVGANPIGIVFSEYALMSAKSWQYLAPILSENKGWAVFISTPRGENHFKSIYDYAIETPSWFGQTLTANDTAYTDANGIRQLAQPPEAIEELRTQGISEATIQQEYFCNFQSEIDGAYYGEQIRKMELANPSQITNVPWEPLLPVYTAWDVGLDDQTVIIFFQVTRGGEIRIIDLIHDKGEGYAYYIRQIQEKPYLYQSHFLPWDFEVRESSTAISRLNTIRSMGLRNCTIVDKSRIEDGIEVTRSLLPRCYFDKAKTKKLIEGLKSYTKESIKQGKDHWASDYADAFRYLAMSQKRHRPRSTDQRSQSSYKPYKLI